MAPKKRKCFDPYEFHSRDLARFSEKDLRLVSPALGFPADSAWCSKCRKHADKLRRAVEDAAGEPAPKQVCRIPPCSPPRPPSPAPPDDNNNNAPPKLVQKYTAEDAEYVFTQLKRKYSSAITMQEKVSVLSLAPPSWSEYRVCNEFGATRYAVRRARELVAANGVVFPDVPSNSKRGKLLSADTRDAVTAFYEDETVSYCTPGMNTKVTVRVNGAKVRKQKKILMSNLDVLFQLFKDRHPDVSIGRSRFAQLRPRHCVYVGTAGTENVCVCEQHQNVTLMCHALRPRLVDNVSWDDMTVFKSYDTLLPAVMCNPAGEECFARKCVVCKNYSDNLRSVLDEVLGDTVTFSRWEKVSKKSQLISRQDSKENFCDLFLQSVCDLAWHDFLARMQQSALWHLKCDMPPGHVLVCADFAENYSFTIQNSVQGFHWNNSQATVHPFVCYFGSEGKTQHLSFVVISNCKDHNSLTVYVFQKQLIAFLKEKFPELHKLIYFTDGCAAQYKNFKSLKNLCEHKSDFGLDAEWHFYATSHGKSACDGVGGTVKREARHACLQSPFQNLIGTPRELFQWCVTKMTGTHFCYVDQEDIEKERLFFETRTGKCSTLTGTMNYHFFRPTGTPNQLECKLYSASARPDLRTVPTKASK
ncbi:Protein CapI [Frankliniella fusca]|uniref:Protein CapI n=1 Tax=Frankliniella fusca TaxID=407009 RepID=A0AAE1I2D1_9NEOP|nr:Protein CapI [Frankliniella fusca]